MSLPTPSQSVSHKRFHQFVNPNKKLSLRHPLPTFGTFSFFQACPRKTPSNTQWGGGASSKFGGIIYTLVEIGLNDLGSVCPPGPASPVPPSLVAATQILQLKNFFWMRASASHNNRFLQIWSGNTDLFFFQPS